MQRCWCWQWSPLGVERTICCTQTANIFTSMAEIYHMLDFRIVLSSGSYKNKSIFGFVHFFTIYSFKSQQKNCCRLALNNHGKQKMEKKRRRKLLSVCAGRQGIFFFGKEITQWMYPRSISICQFLVIFVSLFRERSGRWTREKTTLSEQE